MSSTSSICQHYKSELPSSPWLQIQTPLTFTEDNRKNSPSEWIRSRNGQSPGDPGCLHSLTKTSKHLADDSERVYVHPIEKRSNYSLSTKSLEMCTEGLCNETGSVFYSSMEEFSVLVSEKQSFPEKKHPKGGKFSNKVDYSSCFPPPLSSISGKDVVQVRSHRQGGRLVIKAFSFSCCSTRFRAVREHGRLKLFMCKDESRDCEDLSAENEELGEENGEVLEEFFDEIGDSKLEDCGRLGCRIGGGEWCSSGCKRDENKNLPSLPFCVAIS